MYNEGISKEGDIVDLGSELEIISKRGAFFSYGDQRIGQGRENAKAYLREHTDMAAAIEAAIRSQAGVIKAPLATRAAAEEEESDAEE
jgi:recombination protein RecA